MFLYYFPLLYCLFVFQFIFLLDCSLCKQMGDSNEEFIIVLCTFSVINCYLTDSGFFFRVDCLNKMPTPVFKLVHETKGSTDILY